ncbi:MAG: ABC transporter ATP-binding protein [Dehalococcoidia bacterium]|nr:ABC transporter ATP-binding protein [Dehalococcoidia bacterium]
MEEIIEVEDLWVAYNGMAVLEGINLSVRPNEFLGIIGPNGGGKTTLLKAILGLIQPSHGRVSVLGRPAGESRSRIGYVPQFNTSDREFPINVREVVLMGRTGKAGLFRRYSRVDLEEADQALQTVGMREFGPRRIGELSGGELQRVFVARALVSQPAVLLLDEPTSSIDPAMQTDLYELLVKLKQRMSIIIVSHDIGAISIHVDQIACLNRRLYHHGSKEIAPEVLEATYQCPVQLIAHGHVPHRVLKEH